MVGIFEMCSKLFLDLVRISANKTLVRGKLALVLSSSTVDLEISNVLEVSGYKFGNWKLRGKGCLDVALGIL